MRQSLNLFLLWMPLKPLETAALLHNWRLKLQILLCFPTDKGGPRSRNYHQRGVYFIALKHTINSLSKKNNKSTINFALKVSYPIGEDLKFDPFHPWSQKWVNYFRLKLALLSFLNTTSFGSCIFILFLYFLK